MLRADLLAASATLFAERGFSAVTVADITSHAEVAAGTFYRYFPSKDDVLIELRRSAFEELRKRAAAVLAQGSPDDWWHTAEAMIETTVSFWFEDVARSTVVLRGGYGNDAAGAETALQSAHAAGIATGQRLGVVTRDVDATGAAGFLLHGATGLVYHAIVEEKLRDPKPLVTQIISLAHRLLDPSPP